MKNYSIQPLAKDRFVEAVDLVLSAKLDSREEIEHHLRDLDAHYVAIDDESRKVIGVVGWYQDNVHYANEAMGDKFPGEEVYWVGFFAVEETHRGMGIGFALISKLQEVLTTKGVKELWVSSVPETAEYYQRQGFKYLMDGEIAGRPKVFLVKKW